MSDTKPISFLITGSDHNINHLFVFRCGQQEARANLHSTYVDRQDRREEEHLQEKVGAKSEHRKQTKLLSSIIATTSSKTS